LHRIFTAVAAVACVPKDRRFRAPAHAAAFPHIQIRQCADGPGRMARWFPPGGTELITVYYGSGSPYAWRVWLALEYRRIAYEFRLMSFSAGDLKTPGYQAINPRRKVPAIADDGFAVYESAAIVEYLEDRYPAAPKLFPGDAKQRGTIRRLVREADEYFAHAQERLVDQILFTKKENWDLREIGSAREALAAELGMFERYLTGEWFVNELSAADFTVYPMAALCLRMERRKPDLDVRGAI
jgi:glutathione S-transferase